MYRKWQSGVQLVTRERKILHRKGYQPIPSLSCASYIRHVKHVDKLALSGQLLHRVATQRVKDLEGITYLLNCEVTWFTKGFSLITGLRCDGPYDIEVEFSKIGLLNEYFPKKFGFDIESSKGRRDKGKRKAKMDPKKAVMIRAKSNMAVNLDYFHLIEDMDRLIIPGGVQYHLNNFKTTSFAAFRRGKGRVDDDGGQTRRVESLIGLQRPYVCFSASVGIREIYPRGEEASLLEVDK
ncbi:hypothetical protein DVH24_018763 [Malus domestica]|uniref:Uncharacterized protein n=1 Tax=Malus domestica TaxID=3750 RepID=A0A498HIT7_MALDO|nr:hypothetical protein DVH24_018763 [Malus domestica]